MIRETGTDVRRTYQQDGVVLLPKQLDSEMLARLQACFDWSFANPGPSYYDNSTAADRVNKGDFSNPLAQAVYRDLVLTAPFREALNVLWDSRHAWWYSEETFWKKGNAPGTIWHQDTAYSPWCGDHWVNMWISLDPLPRKNCLGIIRGSHRGPVYDGYSFDPATPNDPYWGDKAGLPLIPDIDAERKADPSSWDVVSFDFEPGDVLCFHPGSLHGGGPVDQDAPQRRTVVLRFFGDRSYWSDMLKVKEHLKDVSASTFDVGGVDYKNAKPGEPFRGESFLQLF